MGLDMALNESPLSRIWATLRRNDAILLISIMVLAVAARLVFLHEPFERDEGSYAYLGQEILRGSIPYRDAIEMKPPGTFYLYALGIWLFGATVGGVRLFTALYLLGTLLAVYLCGRQLLDRRAGLLAALFYAVFNSLPVTQANSSNTEVFLCLPLLAATYCLLKAGATGSRAYLAGSGLFAAGAMLIKTVAVPYVAVFGLFALFIGPNRRTIGDHLKDAAAFAAPFGAFLAAVVLLFAASGAYRDFILWNVTVPLQYAQGAFVSGPPLPQVLRLLAPELLPLVVASLPALFYFLRAIRRYDAALMLCLLPAIVAGISMPMKFFPHYFVQAIPFLAVFAGVGTSFMLAARRPLAIAWLLLLAVPFAYFVRTDFDLYFRDSPELVSMKKYGTVFTEAVAVANYVKKNTRPTDYILQWGFEPEIYFLANRRAPVPYSTSNVMGSLQNKNEGIRNLITGIVVKKPKFIIIQPSWAMMPGYEQLMSVLNTYYHFDTSFGSEFYVYRLN